MHLILITFNYLLCVHVHAEEHVHAMVYRCRWEDSSRVWLLFSFHVGPRNKTQVFSSGGKHFLIFLKNCVSRGVTVAISMWVKGPGEAKHWSSWSWSYRQLWVGRHGVLCNSSYSWSQSLQPCQQVLLSVNPSYRLHLTLYQFLSLCAQESFTTAQFFKTPIFSYVTPYGYNSQFKEVCAHASIP